MIRCNASKARLQGVRRLRKTEPSFKQMCFKAMYSIYIYIYIYFPGSCFNFLPLNKRFGAFLLKIQCPRLETLPGDKIRVLCFFVFSGILSYS